jgi:HK97 family phage prohead protease
MELLPLDHLLKQVEGHDDLVAFRYDFDLSGKALEDGSAAPTVTEDANGDLIIEGYAAVFDGLDREGENFVEGAFTEGIKSFLGGQAALCFHHKHDHVIGKVLDLREEEGKGLFMRARVDAQEKTSPLRYIYDGIKKGSINGLSTGGFFKRALVKGKKMIAGVDFTEISTTGVPVHSGTNFAVVAGKALASDIPAVEVPEDLKDKEIRDSDMQNLVWQIEEITNTLQRVFDGVAARKGD